MDNLYKYILKIICFFNFILNNNILNTNELKYKTIQKTKEQVHHYDCNNIYIQ